MAAKRKNMRLRPQRTARYYYLRFVRLKGDPHTLARGVGIGLFIGVTPTIPFHTVLILLLAFLLRASKIAAILGGVVASNPLTFFFQYYFSWRIGVWLTGSDLSWERIDALVRLFASGAGFGEDLAALGSLSREAIMVLLVGGTTLAAPIALVGYFVSLWFFILVRRKRREKHELR